MIFDYDDVSPRYVEIQEKVLEVLQKSRRALTARQIKAKIGTDVFLADALEIMTFSGLVSVEGSVLIPKYKYLGKQKVAMETKLCPACREVKPLIEFYQEWAGAPSRKCKACKIAAQKNRKRRNA